MHEERDSPRTVFHCVSCCWNVWWISFFLCSKENTSWQREWEEVFDEVRLLGPLHWASWRDWTWGETNQKQAKSFKGSTSLILGEPQGTSSHKDVEDKETEPGLSRINDAISLAPSAMKNMKINAFKQMCTCCRDGCPPPAPTLHIWQRISFNCWCNSLENARTAFSLLLPAVKSQILLEIRGKKYENASGRKSKWWKVRNPMLQMGGGPSCVCEVG